MVLMTVFIIPVLAMANPDIPAVNELTLGTVSAASGSTVLVPVSLVNESSIKGLQLDIQYDEEILTFLGVNAVERGLGMAADGNEIQDGLGRVILFFDDDSVVAPGTGNVAELVFSVQGIPSSSSILTPVDILFSGPNSENIPAVGHAGQVQVDDPTEAPELKISVLKNPGQTRSVQVLVRSINGSGNAPSVSTGESSLILTSVDGVTFQVVYNVADSVEQLTFSASDTNVIGTGTDQVTVSFP